MAAFTIVWNGEHRQCILQHMTVTRSSSNPAQAHDFVRVNRLECNQRALQHTMPVKVNTTLCVTQLNASIAECSLTKYFSLSFNYKLNIFGQGLCSCAIIEYKEQLLGCCSSVGALRRIDAALRPILLATGHHARGIPPWFSVEYILL